MQNNSSCNVQIMQKYYNITISIINIIFVYVYWMQKMLAIFVLFFYCISIYLFYCYFIFIYCNLHYPSQYAIEYRNETLIVKI